MTREETFDLNEFVERLTALPVDAWTSSISQELGRMRGVTVRDASKRFQQQMYVTKLERLARTIRGEDVSNQLTPSEQQAYGRLQTVAPFQAAAEQAAAGTAPATEPPDTEPSGK